MSNKNEEIKQWSIKVKNKHGGNRLLLLGGLLSLHLGINVVSKLQLKPSFDVKSNKKTKHFFIEKINKKKKNFLFWKFFF